MGELPLLCSRELEKGKEALGLNDLASQLSNGQQQCRLPQRAAAQALSDPLHSLSTGLHQINE